MAQEIKYQGTGLQIKFPGLKYIWFSLQIISTVADDWWGIAGFRMAMTYHGFSFT
jgi:hypothetical protein